MEVEARVPQHPPLHFRDLVRGEVVEDEVEVELGRSASIKRPDLYFSPIWPNSPTRSSNSLLDNLPRVVPRRDGAELDVETLVGRWGRLASGRLHRARHPPGEVRVRAGAVACCEEYLLRAVDRAVVGEGLEELHASKSWLCRPQVGSGWPGR